jgi:hypothetical protein
MERAKKILIIFFSVCSIAGVGMGVERAMHSKLFMLQSIEINTIGLSEDPPLSEQDILHLMNIPVGKISLFDLNLATIENKLLANDLIRSVKLQKKTPHQFLVSVHFREPQAIIQVAKGQFALVDEDGEVFGNVDMLRAPDMPILQGFHIKNVEKIKEAVRLLKFWEHSPVHKNSLISSVYWESEKGFRILASYSLKSNAHMRVRTMIDMGQEVDAGLEGKLVRLSNVVGYLSSKSIPARQIWADAGKKVVVKTVRGS